MEGPLENQDGEAEDDEEMPILAEEEDDEDPDLLDILERDIEKGCGWRKIKIQNGEVKFEQQDHVQFGCVPFRCQGDISSPLFYAGLLFCIGESEEHHDSMLALTSIIRTLQDELSACVAKNKYFSSFMDDLKAAVCKGDSDLARKRERLMIVEVV